MDKVEIDKLTKLYSEKSVKGFLEQELLRAKRFSRELSLLYLSVEIPQKIKQDMQYRVLKQLGSFVKKYTRTIDIGCRFGDSVMVILPETPASGAKVAGEKIKDQIEKHIFIHHDTGYEFNVKVNLRIAVFPKDGNDRQALLDHLRKDEMGVLGEMPAEESEPEAVESES